MLQIFLVFCLLLQLLPLLFFKGKKSDDEENIYQKNAKLTYEHFMKVTNDNEMKLYLIANYQDPKDYEGLSRLTICEKMRMKSLITGEKYTRFPF